MDYFTCFLFVCFILLSMQFVQKVYTSRHFPPGPFPLPVIGNILQLGQNPHQSLAKLSQKYGPIMLLKLGSVKTIVITSPDAAKDVLVKHDKEVSDRQIPDTIRACDHYLNSPVWMPANPQWKKLRRASTTHIFTVRKLMDGESIRRQKVNELLHFIDEHVQQKKPIDIGRAIFTAIFNSTTNTLFSKDFATYDNDHSSREFENIFNGIVQEAGKPNISDFFPAIRAFDVQGARRKMTFYFRRMLDTFDEIIAERRASSPKKDVLNSLLELEDAGELNRTEVNEFFVDMFIGGIDTSKATVEWAMAEILRNPQKMEKARKELDQVIGRGVYVQEQDIAKLPYLQAIVKETFRLHPVAPLSVPRKTVTTVEINGFVLPKDAQVSINIWAIGRDPKIWLSPNSFIPERFLNSEIDFKGRDFELIPFGAGKRICPGLPLAYRMVHLVLASLIQSFDWKLEDGLKPEDVDMSEKFGIILHKATPLYAYPLKISS